MTKDQLKFVLSYRPEDDMFTSQEEMDEINDMLCLDTLTREQLISLRNDIVKMFAEIMDREPDRNETFDHWMPTMQSLTAVIDHYKILKGIEV